jgi:hypothetical protein
MEDTKIPEEKGVRTVVKKNRRWKNRILDASYINSVDPLTKKATKKRQARTRIRPRGKNSL